MKIIKQNILEVEGPAVICHQVNCEGIMGGLAGQISFKWPHLFERYIAKSWILGDCQLVKVSGLRASVLEKDIYVANLAGQLYSSSKADCDTDYAMLSRALRVARDFAIANGLTLYLPYMMGCGLAGGDWTIVSEMIDRVAPNAIVCKHEA